MAASDARCMEMWVPKEKEEEEERSRAQRENKGSRGEFASKGGNRVRIAHLAHRDSCKANNRVWFAVVKPNFSSGINKVF